MLEYKHWFDGQSNIHIVGYDTPSYPIKTAICLCKTEKQAIEETNRLNAAQRETARESEERIMQLMHPLGNI